MMIVRCWAYLIVVLLVTAGPSWTQAPPPIAAPSLNAKLPRIALVVGNARYEHAPALENPKNDAQLLEQTLRRAGFDTVTVVNDAGIQSLQNALRSFAASARTAEVALVYFAGHGLEANGHNWLIPTDALLDSDTDLEFEAVRMETVIRAVQGAKVRVVLLDACRDNPFASGMKRISSTTSRGLAAIEVDNVLLMYAAAAGQTASDGANNSPFARSLAAHIPEEGLEVRSLAGKVRDDVFKSTGGMQRPFSMASLTGDGVFLSGIAPASNAALLAELERVKQKLAETQAQASTQPPSASMLLQMRYVGEQADGFLGISTPAASAELENAVKQINDRRREVYADIAARRGVTETDVGKSTACALIKKQPVNAVYRKENGQWALKAGDSALPSRCPRQ